MIEMLSRQPFIAEQPMYHWNYQTQFIMHVSASLLPAPAAYKVCISSKMMLSTITSGLTAEIESLLKVLCAFTILMILLKGMVLLHLYQSAFIPLFWQYYETVQYVSCLSFADVICCTYSCQTCMLRVRCTSNKPANWNLQIGSCLEQGGYRRKICKVNNLQFFTFT